MSEFFDMGGYAAFVWPAYGLTALIMVVVAIISIRAARSTNAAFERLSAQAGKKE